MIQIIGYDQKIVDGKKVKTVKHLEKRWFAEDLPSLFANVEEWLTKNVPQEERVNLHYTLGHTDDRKKRNFTSISAIAFDIDHIHEARIDEYTEVMVKTIGLPNEATIVASGHGLHYIVHLATPLTPTQYKELRRTYVVLCRRIEARLKDKGLPGEVDNQIYRDTATLRLPMTTNRKLGHEDTECVFVRERWEPVHWNLADYIDEREDTTDKPLELKQHVKPHTEGVLTCPFITYCKDNPESVSEPMWYAMITILCRLDSGRDLCHEYSRGYSGYSYTETEEKIDQALAYSGPRTCDNIHMLNAKCTTLCEECLFSVTSPISIKGECYIATQDTGFHTITASGKYIPCKEDLRLYFEKQYNYRVLKKSTAVYIFEDNVWTALEDSVLKNFAQENYSPAPDTRMVNEFVNMVKRTNLVDEDWFNPSGMLNLQNGVLDLSTMELLEHDMNYGFTYMLDYDYDKDATCPQFDKFLGDVLLQRKELISIVLEFFGYAISNAPCDHDKCLILTGEGSNGKSTLLDILTEVIGKMNKSAVSAGDFGIDTKRILMKDKLFNIADETPKKAFLEGSMFKNMVSGGEIVARNLYQMSLEYKNRTKLIFTCNELPISGDPTEGMFRRLILIPFDAYFSEETRDPFIVDKILPEKAGILNRLIEGYHRLKKQRRFTDSSIVRSMVDQYKQDSDTALMWIRERIIITNKEEDMLPLDEIYMDYREYVATTGMNYILNKVMFGKRLQAIIREGEIKRARVGDRRVRVRTCIKFMDEDF